MVQPGTGTVFRKPDGPRRGAICRREKEEENGGEGRKKISIYFVIFLLITTKTSEEITKRIEICNLKELKLIE